MSCHHGNWTGCEECAAEDAAWKEAYESGKADGLKEAQQPPYEERLRDELAKEFFPAAFDYFYRKRDEQTDLSSIRKAAAEEAYLMADAMLQARKQGGE